MISTKRTPFKALVSLAVLSVIVAACGSSTKNGSSPGSGSTSGAVKIGFFGALTGPNAQLGINIDNGVKLAVDQYNAKNKGPKVTLVAYDSQGDPAQAPQLAQKAISDKTTAIVGPAFSGESKVADPIFEQAGIVNVTPSATAPTLATHGWKYWHRIVGNDSAQGPAAASFIAKKLGAKRVAVVDDNSEYGKGLADIVRTSLASDGVTVVGGGSIDPNATDYSTTVNPIKAANVDAVYFGGYYDAAARLLKQMRDAGVQAKFVSDDGTKDPKFVSEATAADANGAYVTCACRDVSGSAAGRAFDTAYQSAFNTAAGTYSAEGYDAANVILTAISAGNSSSTAINNYLADHTFIGITKTIKFASNGDISGAVIYVYEVQNGTINFLGSAASLTQ